MYLNVNRFVWRVRGIESTAFTYTSRCFTGGLLRASRCFLDGLPQSFVRCDGLLYTVDSPISNCTFQELLIKERRKESNGERV